MTYLYHLTLKIDDLPLSLELWDQFQQMEKTSAIIMLGKYLVPKYNNEMKFHLKL